MSRVTIERVMSHVCGGVTRHVMTGSGETSANLELLQESCPV